MAAKKRVAEGIYERNGSYQVAVYDPQLRKTVWLTGIPSLKQARQTRIEEKERRKRSKNLKKDVAVEEFVALWGDPEGPYQASRNAQSSRIHNKERTSKFGADFKGRALKDISRQEARAWAMENRSRLKPVAAMYSDALRDGIVSENPFRGIRLPRKEGGKPLRKGKDIITEPELDLLIDVAATQHGEFGPTFARMIETAAYTGLRPGELFALRHGDIDYAEGKLHVRRAFQDRTKVMTEGKYDARRTVPLLSRAEEGFRYLRKFQGTVEDDRVFFTTRGKPYTGRTHHYYFNPVRSVFLSKLPPSRQETLGVFDWYELRHFFGSQLARMGLMPYDIAKFMGHKDGGRLAMSLYIHTDEDEALERARRAEVLYTCAKASCASLLPIVPIDHSRAQIASDWLR